MSPAQAVPPNCSATATVRVRVWLPPLQGRLHLPHSDQSDSWQFTGVLVVLRVAVVNVAVCEVVDVIVDVLK